MTCDLWRATRNQYTRRVYAVLKRNGLTATMLYDFERSLESTRREDEEPDTRQLSCRVSELSTISSIDPPEMALHPEETVIAAWWGGTPSGYAFVSHNLTLYIDPLEKEYSFETGYIRRVFVAPEYRNRGIATKLIQQACTYLSERSATTAKALIAFDNLPSLNLFRGCGFEAVGYHQYLRVGPFCRRRSKRDSVSSM
jgi:GNAT superfamily N-acetyltransferase